MDDVAARAGVSRAAVSFALGGSPKVSASQRAHILRIATELGYRRNSNATRLASGRAGTIGIVFSDLHNVLYAEALDGLADGLLDGSQQLLLASGFHDPIRERAAIESFLSHRVDGLALLGSVLPVEEIQQLAHEVPTVAAGRRVPGVDWVTVDDTAGAVQATEHLISLGHRRIGHIDGGSGAGATLRREEFLATMRRRRLARGAKVVAGDYTEQTGRAAALELLRSPDRVTAIFAANDLSALGVLAAAHTLDIRVPDDLSVIGFDNTEIAQYQLVQLSTIDYARYDMGQRTLAQLEKRISDRTRDPVYETLETTLIARRTTAPPPPSPA